MKLRTELLSESVKRLHLKPNSPYPTETKAFTEECDDSRQMILAWRRAQEKVQLKEVK